MNELIVIENKDVLEIFTNDGIDPILNKIKEEVRKFVPDMTTKKGRDEIASMAHKVAKSKTLLDGKGKTLTEEWRANTKKVNDARNKIKKELDDLRDEVRRPLTEWQEKDKKRQANHNATIELIKALAGSVDSSGISFSVAELKENLAKLEAIVTDEETMEEFHMTATTEKSKSLTILKSRITELENFERQEAENKRLREEQEKREREEYERKLKEEAAAKAKEEAEREAREEAERKEKDRLAEIQKQKDEQERVEREKKEAIELAERLEREKKEAEERAAQDKIASEKRARDREVELKRQAKKEKQEALEAERLRVKKEEEAKAEAERKRQADIKHRTTINNAALETLIENTSFLTKEQAKEVVKIIALGKVANITIRY